jgi:hypothetical protein
VPILQIQLKSANQLAKSFFLQYWGCKAKKYPHQLHDEDLIKSETSSD